MVQDSVGVVGGSLALHEICQYLCFVNLKGVGCAMTFACGSGGRVGGLDVSGLFY
jgi:hypothetical protein